MRLIDDWSWQKIRRGGLLISLTVERAQSRLVCLSLSINIGWLQNALEKSCNCLVNVEISSLRQLAVPIY